MEKPSQSYGASPTIWDQKAACHLTQVNVSPTEPKRV